MLCPSNYAASADCVTLWRKLCAGLFDRGVYPRCRRDGTELWLQATYSPLYRDGHVHRILKIASDVTDKLLLERALK